MMAAYRITSTSNDLMASKHVFPSHGSFPEINFYVVRDTRQVLWSVVPVFPRVHGVNPNRTRLISKPVGDVYRVYRVV